MTKFECWDEEVDDTMSDEWRHVIEARNAGNAAEKLARDIIESGDWGTFPITVRAPDGTVTRWDVEVTEPTFCANPRRPPAVPECSDPSGHEDNGTGECTNCGLLRP